METLFASIIIFANTIMNNSLYPKRLSTFCTIYFRININNEMKTDLKY